MVDQADQRARRQNLRPVGPGGFGAVRLGTDQAQPHGRGGDGGGQRAADRGDLTVQPKLAHGGPAVQRIGRDHAHGGQKG